MFTTLFWKLSAERAVKTFAQALAGALAAGGVGLFSANWTLALSTAAMAAVVSVLTSIGSVNIGTPGTPSVVRHDPPSAADPATVPQPPVVAPAAPVPAAAAAA